MQHFTAPFHVHLRTGIGFSLACFPSTSFHHFTASYPRSNASITADGCSHITQINITTPCSTVLKDFLDRAEMKSKVIISTSFAIYVVFYRKFWVVQFQQDFHIIRSPQPSPSSMAGESSHSVVLELVKQHFPEASFNSLRQASRHFRPKIKIPPTE